MTDMDAFDRLIAREVVRASAPSRPVDDAAIFTAITTTQSPKWRFGSMFSATKFVVAGAIVALFGGFLLAGVLTTQPSDDRLTVVGASASATTQAEPTDAATSEPEPTTDGRADDTTALELLPGVELAIEEVELAVYRVLNDGMRSLSRPVDYRRPGVHMPTMDGSVATGLDGSVWWFGLDDFFRLGDEHTYDWPAQLRQAHREAEGYPGAVIGWHDFEVGPDGIVWLAPSGLGMPLKADGTPLIQGLVSFDGQEWAVRQKTPNGGRILGVEVQEDGTVWAAWVNEQNKNSVARLTDDGWEALRGTLEGGSADQVGAGLAVARETEGDVWFGTRDLIFFDGETREREYWTGFGRFDVGPDGTFWGRLQAGDGQMFMRRTPDGEWTNYDATDGILDLQNPTLFPYGLLEVAPDGSVWYGSGGIDQRGGGGCNGLARHDGASGASYLEDWCITAMDIDAEGNVWVQAWDTQADPIEEVHTFVIAHEAVATTE